MKLRTDCEGAAGYDVAMIEIGGTVGDIESQPFWKQFANAQEFRSAPIFMHLTLCRILLVPANKLSRRNTPLRYCL